MFFERNICQFVNGIKNEEVLYPLHFVLETKKQPDQSGSLSVFRINYVLEGTATFSTRTTKTTVKEGDVFFCLPLKQYSLKSDEGFKYAYVSYFGTRAAVLAEKIKLSESNCVFQNLGELKILWRNALPVNEGVTDLRAESVVLYTFSTIWEKTIASNTPSTSVNAATEAKKYVDTHFSDPTVSLSSVCKTLSYSEKYLSALFSKQYKINFSKYVNSIRVEHACSLIERGYTSIKTVAFLCGYQDPLYFSKIFKSFKGVSPKFYVNKLKTNK